MLVACYFSNSVVFWSFLVTMRAPLTLTTCCTTQFLIARCAVGYMPIIITIIIIIIIIIIIYFVKEQQLLTIFNITVIKKEKVNNRKVQFTNNINTK